MTPVRDLIMSRVLLQVEPTGNDSVTTDWSPGVLLVLFIFGAWLFWRYRRRRKLP